MGRKPLRLGKHRAFNVREEFDPKDYVLSLADRGELLMCCSLGEQLHAALVNLGFVGVRVEYCPERDIWMILATVGVNNNCTGARRARFYLHRMARSVGKRLTRCVDYLVVQDGTLRAGVTLVNPLRLD